jgi:NAD-dependent dihydropyrimidine dehydrogenase PreA subunit
MNKIVIIDEILCTGCGQCVAMCPKRILYLEQETRKCKVTDETKCDRLRGCEWACPVQAIKIK